MYEEQKFSLPTMKGLSEKLIAEHLKLYSGYVKNTNDLRERIRLAEVSGSDPYTTNELRRRLPFEWNGMRLHEYYFEALGGSGTLPSDNLKGRFSNFDEWLLNFKRAGLTRGTGWLLLVEDNKNRSLETVWVSDHQIGHLAGTNIIIAMDLWEHAYLTDYLPLERKAYIEAFFDNLNWDVASSRLGR